MNATCELDECDKPAKRLGLCYGHYMKQWRYGDPRFEQTFPDLAGARFGSLVAVRRVDGRWLCRCDCGADRTARTGDLNRGSAVNCGDRSKHQRRAVASYGAAHMRVLTDRGPASAHDCVDCERDAAQWSYDHADPDELQDVRGRYSLNPDHYAPRCVSCHKRFDLALLAGRTTKG